MNDSKRAGVSVELVGLEKYYKNVSALKGLNLRANPGELVVMLGPSGCGKTTALRALAGLETLDGGQILIAGKDVTSLPAAKRNIGMVFQNYSLFPNMTAKVNVEFGLRARGVSAKIRAARSTEILSLVGLSAQSDRYPHQLSGGQQQRVALARALAIEPEVLLLDEPLSALDAQVRGQLREEIRRIQLELGITTFFVTHDQEEALALADRIAVMQGGELEQYDSPMEVYARPGTEFVAQFVGQVNRLRGVVTKSGHVQVEGLGEIAFESASVEVFPGSAVEVLIRPESIGVVPDPLGHVKVEALSFLGSIVKAKLRDGETIITSSFANAEVGSLGLGSTVAITAKAKAILVTGASSLPSGKGVEATQSVSSIGV